MKTVVERSMNNKIIRAKNVGLASCHICDLVIELGDNDATCCPRCNSKIHYRKHNSINRAWALLISAFIMYIPANTEAIMVTGGLGQESADTIISGVIYFIATGDWPLALVIF